MFDQKYLYRNKDRHLLEYMNALNQTVDLHLKNRDYHAALPHALELRRIVLENFHAKHPYRGLIYQRTGFLYFVMGLWTESEQELERAHKVFSWKHHAFRLEIFQTNHLLFELAVIRGEKDRIIERTAPLLNDPLLSIRLEVRIYITLAEQYVFGHGKDMSLTRDYLFWANYLLTTHNATSGLNYANLLYLYGKYYSEIRDVDLALTYLEELQCMIHNEELPRHRARYLKRSSEHLMRKLDPNYPHEHHSVERSLFH